MPPIRVVAATFLAIMLSSGCEQKKAAANPDSQTATEFRENTKPLQAADLVGYDGTKLKKSVEKIQQDSDRHGNELEDAAEDR